MSPILTAARAVRDGPTAQAFLRECCDALDLGFHPDTRFADYEDLNGNRCFDDAEAAELDLAMGTTFELCDPYVFSLVYVATHDRVAELEAERAKLPAAAERDWPRAVERDELRGELAELKGGTP